MENDYRLCNIKNNMRFLFHSKLKYKHLNLQDNWNHEHCEFCWDQISEYPGYLHCGYCTLDETH